MLHRKSSRRQRFSLRHAPRRLLQRPPRLQLQRLQRRLLTRSLSPTHPQRLPLQQHLQQVALSRPQRKTSWRQLVPPQQRRPLAGRPLPRRPLRSQLLQAMPPNRNQQPKFWLQRVPRKPVRLLRQRQQQRPVRRLRQPALLPLRSPPPRDRSLQCRKCWPRFAVGSQPRLQPVPRPLHRLQ